MKGDFDETHPIQHSTFPTLGSYADRSLASRGMFNELHQQALEQISKDDLPDTNPKTRYGVQKAPMHLIPPPALLAEADVFGLGAKKYGPYNWREHAVSASVYQAAALRHLMAWWEGEDSDPESGQSHLAHARACLGILLDAGSRGMLNDDRPIFPKEERE